MKYDLNKEQDRIAVQVRLNKLKGDGALVELTDSELILSKNDGTLKYWYEFVRM